MYLFISLASIGFLKSNSDHWDINVLQQLKNNMILTLLTTFLFRLFRVFLYILGVAKSPFIVLLGRFFFQANALSGKNNALTYRCPVTNVLRVIHSLTTKYKFSIICRCRNRRFFFFEDVWLCRRNILRYIKMQIYNLIAFHENPWNGIFL